MLLKLTHTCLKWYGWIQDTEKNRKKYTHKKRTLTESTIFLSIYRCLCTMEFRSFRVEDCEHWFVFFVKHSIRNRKLKRIFAHALLNLTISMNCMTHTHKIGNHKRRWIDRDGDAKRDRENVKKVYWLQNSIKINPTQIEWHSFFPALCCFLFLLLNKHFCLIYNR